MRGGETRISKDSFRSRISSGSRRMPFFRKKPATAEISFSVISGKPPNARESDSGAAPPGTTRFPAAATPARISSADWKTSSLTRRRSSGAENSTAQRTARRQQASRQSSRAHGRRRNACADSSPCGFPHGSNPAMSLPAPGCGKALRVPCGRQDTIPDARTVPTPRPEKVPRRGNRSCASGSFHRRS